MISVVCVNSGTKRPERSTLLRVGAGDFVGSEMIMNFDVAYLNFLIYKYDLFTRNIAMMLYYGGGNNASLCL